MTTAPPLFPAINCAIAGITFVLATNTLGSHSVTDADDRKIPSSPTLEKREHHPSLTPPRGHPYLGIRYGKSR